MRASMQEGEAHSKVVVRYSVHLDLRLASNKTKAVELLRRARSGFDGTSITPDRAVLAIIANPARLFSEGLVREFDSCRHAM